MNFFQIGFLDNFDLTASLKSRLHLFPEADEEGWRILDIRWPNEAGGWKVHAHAAKANWAELHATLTRIQRLGNGQFERGRVWLEILEPGSRLKWRMEESNGYQRLYHTIRTNPAVMMFGGTEVHHLLPGTLTIVPISGWCMVNLGEWQALHLVVEFRQKPDVAV